MKKSVTTLSVNMDPYTLGHITISYYISISKKRSRYIKTVYVRHGSLVVSMPVYPGMAFPRMLRAMLTALCLFPKLLNCLPCSRSRFILSASVKAFTKVNVRKFIRMPLTELSQEAVKSVALLSSTNLGGHLRLRSSQSVETTLINLLVSYCSLIQFYAQQKTSTEMIVR